jgi:hypothetical protein
MPTGYTEGILDGTTKDFAEFAKRCARAFLIHMREEPIDSEYVERKVSQYSFDAVKRCEQELKNTKNLSDKEIIDQSINRLLNGLQCRKDAIKKNDEDKLKLNDFLEKANKYKPPTEYHEGVRKLMIKQLEITIDHDCEKNTWNLDAIKQIESELSSLNADNIRRELIESETKSLLIRQKYLQSEIDGCIATNKWYDDFINSLQ